MLRNSETGCISATEQRRSVRGRDTTSSVADRANKNITCNRARKVFASRARGFGSIDGAQSRMGGRGIRIYSGRISTGAVINVGHVDPRRFLEGARRTVISRVTDAITTHKGPFIQPPSRAFRAVRAGRNLYAKAYGELGASESSGASVPCRARRLLVAR